MLGLEAEWSGRPVREPWQVLSQKDLKLESEPLPEGSMERIAVGDLLIDLNLPDDYACEYSLSGSLLAHDEARGIELEISSITAEGKDSDSLDFGIRHVLSSAKSKRRTVVLEQDDLVITREECHWYAGFGNRVVVLTLGSDNEEPPVNEVVKILTSVAPAHGPLCPDANGIAITSLSQSHALLFPPAA